MAIAIIMAITAAANPIVKPDIVARFDTGEAVGAGVIAGLLTVNEVSAKDGQ